MSRAVENGVDLGAAIPTYNPFQDANVSWVDVPAPTEPEKPKVIRLQGEEARQYVLEHYAGAKWFAYLHVVEGKTGRLLQEYPYRQLAEVKAKLAEVEGKHPGLLRLDIVKRLEIPEESKLDRFTALVVNHPSCGLTVTIRSRK
ncbi:MAG: hypothetical protein ACKODX_14000 [Gemmata sp.]